MIKIFNTLTNTKEEFKPLENNIVKMYVCGVTVYDNCHIGHARAAVVFDTIRRYLMYKNYKVIFVKNFTDIDDKIIKKANELAIPWYKVSEKYINEHNSDMAQLNVLEPDFAPKATEFIDEMIKICQILIEKGYAYEINGDVFFRVRKFKGYGKLSHRQLNELLAGARVEVNEQKEYPLDFALWKKSKPNEPSFSSPWGQGRPGWHIECSAMSAKLLGLPFDIHGGGKDLVFPHHENEIAQTEAAFEKPLANYWLHNGFVNIDKEKMSKSTGNFYTIKEVLSEFSPEVLRLFLLSSHYLNQLDFNFENLIDFEKSVEKYYLLLNRIDEYKCVKKIKDKINNYKSITEKFIADFEKAMDDNFNTPVAIASVFELIRETNKFLDQKIDSETFNSVKNDFFNAIKIVQNVLGIYNKKASDWFKENLTISEEELIALIEKRNIARKNKNFVEADAIRAELLKKGIELHDTMNGTKYTARRIHQLNK
jgi:cysteinyl-tRNA synthetase